MIHPPKQEEPQISAQRNPNDSGFGSNALVPRLDALAQLAKSANMALTIDAEESDRLSLSLDVIEAVLQNPAFIPSVRTFASFFGSPQLPVICLNGLMQMGGDHGSSGQGNTR